MLLVLSFSNAFLTFVLNFVFPVPPVRTGPQRLLPVHQVCARPHVRWTDPRQGRDHLVQSHCHALLSSLGSNWDSFWTHRQGSVTDEGPLKRHSSIAQFISSSCLDTSHANFIVSQTVIISNKKLQNISCLVACLKPADCVCPKNAVVPQSKVCLRGARRQVWRGFNSCVGAPVREANY